MIFELSSESMVVTDAENRIITVNPAFTALTGYTAEEVVGKNPRMLKSGKQSKEFYRAMWDALNTTGHWQGEVWNQRKNGELYAEWLSVNVIYNEDGTKRMHVAIFSDITKKKMADTVIWNHANFDQLTLLPNRRLFLDRLEQGVKVAHRTGDSLALLFIDLDRFKEVNDTLGHEGGDQLLVEAASRIKQCVREMDTVARMGGDEFTVILPQLADPHYAGKIAEAIIGKLTTPFVISSLEFDVSASIGIAVYPGDGDCADQMLKNADKAMYDAKHNGRGYFSYFGGPNKAAGAGDGGARRSARAGQDLPGPG